MSMPNRQTSPVASAPPAGRLILLADGSRAHRRMLSVQLERAGYRVIEAEDGPTALDLCRTHEPDLILSDWMLNGLSGPELCRAHRGLPRRDYGYFILLTSKTGSADIAQGLGAGADDFLIKPISGAELLARIHAGQRLLDMQRDLSAANRDLRETLAQLKLAQDQMTSDLREARKLQQALIAERQRSFGPLRVSLLMRPAGLIGGDLVGFHAIDDRTVAVHAVDVSGHGIASALLTARLAAQIEALSRTLWREDRLSPPILVAALNEMMLEGVQTDNYLTMIYALIDLPTGQVRMVQAGHPHPLIQRENGDIVRVGDGGLPVGVLAEARYQEISVTLAPGDRMLVVSDGITDSTSHRGAVLGESGLRAILQLNRPLSGHGFLESMCWSASEFSGGERADDCSAVLIEYLQDGEVVPLHDDDG